MHSDEEISQIIGCGCVTEKLHHWPLSFVLLVSAEDGARYIYKAQRSGVEAEFFRRAADIDAPFLVRPVYSARCADTDVMIFPYIENRKREPTCGQHLAEVRSLRNVIASLEGKCPIWLDISTPEKLAAAAEEAVEIAGDALPEGRAEAYLEWIWHSGPLFDRGVGFIHGDLTASNLLHSGNSMYIIDWQRPLLAPFVLEEACSFDIKDMRNAVPQEAYLMAAAYHAIWYARAWRDYMPELEGIRLHAVELMEEFYRGPIKG